MSTLLALSIGTVMLLLLLLLEVTCCEKSLREALVLVLPSSTSKFDVDRGVPASFNPKVARSASSLPSSGEEDEDKDESSVTGCTASCPVCMASTWSGATPLTCQRRGEHSSGRTADPARNLALSRHGGFPLVLRCEPPSWRKCLDGPGAVSSLLKKCTRRSASTRPGQAKRSEASGDPKQNSQPSSTAHRRSITSHSRLGSLSPRPPQVPDRAS